MNAKLFLEKINIFEAQKGGYAHYRVPGLVVTTKGTLLAYGEARKSTRSDWGNIDIMMRRSTDGGKTWEERQQISKILGKYLKIQLRCYKTLPQKMS